MGKVFGIIEINTPNRDNANIIAQLITEIEESYYSDSEDVEPEVAFEQALMKANKKFNKLIENHPTYLVGTLDQHSIKEKINLAVGVLKGDSLLLSHLNSVGAFLIHKTKQDYTIIDIAGEEEAEEESENINIFSNIISGKLQPDDYFFLSNKDFLEFITQERIRKITSSLPPHKATEYFKNALLQHEGYNFAAIIIQQQLHELEDEDVPESLSSIDDLNLTESNTEQLLSPSFLPTLGSLAKNVVHRVRQQISKGSGDDEVVEVIEEDEIMTSPVSEPTDTTIEEAENYAETIAEPQPQQEVSKASRINTDKIKTVAHDAATSSKKAIKTILPPERFTRVKKFFYLKWNQGVNKLKSIPQLSKWLLIFAIVFSILLLFSIAFLQHRQRSEELSTDFTELLSQVENKTADAESKIIIGDDEAAKTALIEAQALLEELPVDSNKQKQSFQQLSSNIENLIIKLRKITKVDEPTDLGTVTSDTGDVDIQHIVLDNGELYAVNAAQQSISRIQNGEVTVALSSNEILQNIRNVELIDGAITIYHENGFHIFEPSTRAITSLPVVVGANHDILDYTLYNNRLYTIDKTPNQIIRHAQEGEGYGGGVNWLSQAFDLSAVIGMGIDTNIWVMDSSGKISKLNKGRRADFAQPDIDPQLESPTQFFTGDETNFLYILEPSNRRIVVLDKEGNLETQYFSERFDNLKNFFVSEKDKEIYLVNGNTIFSIDLSHL